MNYSYILFFSILDKQQTLYITVSQLSLLPDYGYSAVIAERAHTVSYTHLTLPTIYSV